MPVLDVRGAVKTYDSKRAVDGISLAVEKGEIFGLLGPNGAGKTSLIRMIMDITRPDAGEILLFGARITPETKNRVGYLPEERGLYQKQRVVDILAFLGMLKGLPRHVARVRADRYLDRVGLLEVRRKKMRELSKGMQQKVQIAAVLLSEPELLILDEPFSGLDPVNRVLIIDIMKEFSARGSSLILSTHLMDQVEALCNRVILINKGREILHGGVREIQERHADNAVVVETDAKLEGFPGVERVHGSKVWLATPPEQFLAALLATGAKVRKFERALPSMDEIFVKAVA
jgi:ABC-2 type transport system ATP-binding protein